MTDTSPLLIAVLLLGGILPLAVGPFLAEWAERSKGTKTALDAFIAVSLGGIVILHLWPHAFLVAGGWALVGGLAGLLLPFLLHGSLHFHERKIYPTMVAIAFLGLAIHAALDGVALLSPALVESESVPAQHVHSEDFAEHGHSPSHDHHEEEHDGHEKEEHGDLEEGTSAHHHAQGSAALLALAVILHRLPMGIAVWWLVVPILGRRAAISLLATIAGATVLGFSIAGRVLVDLSMPGIAIFEATIAGMLLHVVMGHEHDHGAHGHEEHEHGEREHGDEHSPGGHPHSLPHEEAPWISALGALAGAGLVVVLCQVHPMEQRFAQELSFAEAFTALSIYLAPFFLAGAVLEVLFSRWTLRAPHAIRLEIALPTFLVTFALLGWRWTLFYALGVAWILLVSLYMGRPRGRDANSESELEPTPRFSLRDLPARFEQIVRFCGTWGLIGIGTAALLEPILRIEPSSVVPSWLGPGFALAAAAILGIFCCRHSLLGIILAFFLLHMDWSPPTVLCFLLSGVAARTLRESSISKGRFLLSCLGLIPLFLGSQFLFAATAADFHRLAEVEAAGLQVAALVVLAALMAFSLFRWGFRGFLQPVFGFPTETATAELSLQRRSSNLEPKLGNEPV